MKTRLGYFNRFISHQKDDIRIYNTVHRMGEGLADTGDGNWLAAVERTGEFFPGREQVRPNLNFGISSKKKNSRSCRKNYTKSETHSPGIFTVQCVCRYPKLIGLSVMEECEGVSTALSILLS